jgi:glycolate oxidase
MICAMSRIRTRAADAAQALRRELGSEAVITDESRLEALSGDKWFAHHRPHLAVFPKNREEVVAVIKAASESKLPVTMRGSGYGYVGGCVPVKGGIVLAMERMNRIKEIDGADFVAVVEPGVITGDLHSAARNNGLYYPPDPASLKNCTIGGNIATNAGGPRCLKYGVTRTYVLGLEVVLANGAIVRCGGRTHKNKTGFDLVGLFVGSEGLLGVVTEATLRLLPHPPVRAALSAGFGNMPAAAKAIQIVLAGGPLHARGRKEVQAGGLFPSGQRASAPRSGRPACQRARGGAGARAASSQSARD